MMKMFNETQTHITHTDNNIPKMLIRSCYIDNEEFIVFIVSVVDFYQEISGLFQSRSQNSKA